MGSFRYKIDIGEYQTRMALRYFLLENFEIGEVKSSHTPYGETNIVTLPIRLKPEKWDKKYNHTVDTVAPTGSVTATSAEGRDTEWKELVSDLTFGFWSKQKITVMGTSDDATSPIAAVDYETANAMKTDKGGKREADTPETALLKRKVICAECGHHYTRRRNYSGTREHWECPNRCKIPVFMDDAFLYEKLRNLLNDVIFAPDVLRYGADSEDVYQPTLELMRQDRKIDRMTEQKNPKFLPIKGAIYDAAFSRFDCCRLDASKAVTDRLIEYIKTLEPMEALDFSLIDRIVKSISVHGNGTLSVKFLNDKTIDEKEDTDHAGDNDSTESSNKDCG